MKHKDITHYKQELDDLFDMVRQLPTSSKIKSHWAKYLCVRVSGFLEIAINLIYTQYVEKRAHSNVAKYAKQNLRRFQNPKMSKIYELVGSFDNAWREELEKETTEQIKNSVDSLVAQRNSIAHGQTSNLTYLQTKQYYEDALKLVKLLEKQCE